MSATGNREDSQACAAVTTQLSMCENLQSSSCRQAAHQQCCGWSVAVALFTKALCTTQAACCTYTCLAELSWLWLFESIGVSGLPLWLSACVCLRGCRGRANGEVFDSTKARGKPIVYLYGSRPFTGGICAGGHSRAVGWPPDCYTPLRHLTTTTVPALHPTPTQQTHNGPLRHACCMWTASASVLLSVLLRCPLLPLPLATKVLRRRCQQ